VKGSRNYCIKEINARLLACSWFRRNIPQSETGLRRGRNINNFSNFIPPQKTPAGLDKK